MRVVEGLESAGVSEEGGQGVEFAAPFYGLLLLLCLVIMVALCAKSKKSCLETEQKGAEDDAATFYDEIQISYSSPLPDEITEHSPSHLSRGGGSARECNGSGPLEMMETTGQNGERSSHTLDRKLPEPPTICTEEQETALTASLPSNPAPDNGAVAPGNAVVMRTPDTSAPDNNRGSTASMDTYEKIGNYEQRPTPLTPATGENLYAGLEDDENPYQRVGGDSAQSSASSDALLSRKQPPSSPPVHSGSSSSNAIYSNISKEDSGEGYESVIPQGEQPQDLRKMAAFTTTPTYDQSDILDCYETVIPIDPVVRPRMATEPARASPRSRGNHPKRHIYSEIQNHDDSDADVYSVVHKRVHSSPPVHPVDEVTYGEAPPIPPRLDDLDVDGDDPDLESVVTAGDDPSDDDDDAAYLSIQEVEDGEEDTLPPRYPLQRPPEESGALRDSGYGRVLPTPLHRPVSEESENIYEGVEEESYEVIKNVYELCNDGGAAGATGGHDSLARADPVPIDRAKISPPEGAACANRLSTASDIYAQVVDDDAAVATPAVVATTAHDPPQPPSLESLRTVSAAHRSPSPSRHSYSPVTNERRGSYHEAINEGLKKSQESMDSDTERQLKGRSMPLDFFKLSTKKLSGEPRTSPRHGHGSPNRPNSRTSNTSLSPGALTPTLPSQLSPDDPVVVRLPRQLSPGPWVHIDSMAPPNDEYWSRRDHMYETVDPPRVSRVYSAETRLDADGLPVTYL